MDTIITLNPKQKSFGCNCRKKDSCPLNGECLTTKVIYRADVLNEANNDQTFFLGLAERTFKERYSNPKQDVKYIKYQYNTELTKYIRNLKNNSIKYNIRWKVVDKVYGNANSTMLRLCLTEKHWIINHINDNNILNKKSELVNKCRHLKMFLLKRKEKTVNFSFMHICILYFSSKHNNFLFIFR